jgi:putative endonuclease
MTNTRRQGSNWERTAESFLRSHGLKMIARNFHGRFGEIDLIMLDGGTLAFIEVRFRSSSNFGTGADSVTPVKQKRIICAARRFLQREKQHASRPCRFDVVSIGKDRGKPVINWIQSAFDAG